MPKLSSTQKLVRAGMLAAITIVLAMTPLGYIPVNPTVTITLMVIPVALGGLFLGWPYGTVLGLIFGVTSFIRAPTEFLGQVLLSQSLGMTVVTCIVPRALVGLCADIFNYFMRRRPKLRRVWYYSLTGFVCSLCNTVLFLGFVSLLFNAASVHAASEAMGAALDITFFALIGLVAFNGLLEMGVGAVLVGILARVVIPSPDRDDPPPDDPLGTEG